MYHDEDVSAIWNKDEFKIIDFATKSSHDVEVEFGL